MPVKQETSKGVKRPHSSDTTDVPKAASRLVNANGRNVHNTVENISNASHMQFGSTARGVFLSVS